MDVNILEIAKAVGGKPLSAPREAIEIGKISTDTRVIGKNDVFFALRGLHFDGHDFVEQAFEKGARHFVLSDPSKAPKNGKGECHVLLVKDVLTAYGDFAFFYRRKFKIPALAVTGSSGKTTVKELAAHALSSKFTVLKNKGTENNLVGVPKTILQLEPSHEALVLEMGTNQPGEIARLSEIIEPQLAILTQIGDSHLEKLKNREGVREEKLGLLAHLERGGTLFINNEDPMLKEVKSGAHRVIRVGFGQEGNDFFADNIWCHEGGSSFRMNGKEIFDIPLIGRHNILNSLLAIAAAVTFGVDTELIRKSLKEFKPVSGRLNLKTIEGVVFIDDSYNSNPTSFRAALDTLKSFKTRGKKAVVFGDMLELGDKAEDFHREIGALLAELMFDFVIGAGPLAQVAIEEALKRGFNRSRAYPVQDSVEAGKLCRQMAAPGDMVLVKGSRGMKMEKVF